MLNIMNEKLKLLLMQVNRDVLLLQPIWQVVELILNLTPEARNAGGLYILGTERHESRRIDNQLRGRSGRQGDPGESRFYISLEDDLIRIFAGDTLRKIWNALV